MVTLKNIIKTENDISADYYPEGIEPKGFLRIGLSDTEVIEHIGDPCSMAPAHVRSELIRLSKSDNIPSEKTVLWY